MSPLYCRTCKYWTLPLVSQYKVEHSWKACLWEHEGLQTQPAQKRAGAISTFHFIDPLSAWLSGAIRVSWKVMKSSLNVFFFTTTDILIDKKLHIVLYWWSHSLTKQWYKYHLDFTHTIGPPQPISVILNKTSWIKYTVSMFCQNLTSGVWNSVCDTWKEQTKHELPPDFITGDNQHFTV